MPGMARAVGPSPVIDGVPTVARRFTVAGPPSEASLFVFNGDFVDRGAWGLETLLLFLAWKLALPRHVFLLRGNHETALCTMVYGFKGELVAKMGRGKWKVGGAAGDLLCWTAPLHRGHGSSPCRGPEARALSLAVSTSLHAPGSLPFSKRTGLRALARSAAGPTRVSHTLLPPSPTDPATSSSPPRLTRPPPPPSPLVPTAQTVYTACKRVFSVLPLSICIAQRALVLHGGLFRKPRTSARGRQKRQSARGEEGGGQAGTHAGTVHRRDG